VRGVRREVVAAGGAVKNEVPSKIKVPSMDDILRYAAPFVAEVDQGQFTAGLRNLYKQ